MATYTQWDLVEVLTEEFALRTKRDVKGEIVERKVLYTLDQEDPTIVPPEIERWLRGGAQWITRIAIPFIRREPGVEDYKHGPSLMGYVWRLGGVCDIDTGHMVATVKEQAKVRDEHQLDMLRVAIRQDVDNILATLDTGMVMGLEVDIHTTTDYTITAKLRHGAVNQYVLSVELAAGTRRVLTRFPGAVDVGHDGIAKIADDVRRIRDNIPF